jgi:nucleoside-diphosphate-sugar epimerase
MSKKPKVLVTGGAGFIGSHLVDRLVERDFDVRVLDNLSTGNRENIVDHLKSGAVDFIEGDIRDKETVSKSVVDCDMVVHLAAIVSVPFSVQNPSVTFDVNSLGTVNLLRSSAEAGVKKFVFVSSCAVYGDPDFLPVKETYSTNPLSPYAISKLAGEEFCLDFHAKGLLRSAVVRLFNVYGVRQGLSEYSGVITKFMDCCRRGCPLTVYGDGLQTRDFVSVHDVVSALLACMENSRADGEVFNIGTGKAVTVNELAETVLSLTGLNLGIRHEKPRAGDIEQSFADISKAQGVLGFKPRVSLEDGLRDLLCENGFSKECVEKLSNL